MPKLDIRGALCISGALAGITYGLIAASAEGWGSLPVLLPPQFAATVLRYLHDFTARAARLTAYGLAFLVVTALMMIQRRVRSRGL